MDLLWFFSFPISRINCVMCVQNGQWTHQIQLILPLFIFNYNFCFRMYVDLKKWCVKCVKQIEMIRKLSQETEKKKCCSSFNLMETRKLNGAKCTLKMNNFSFNGLKVAWILIQIKFCVSFFFSSIFTELLFLCKHCIIFVSNKMTE